MSLYKAKLETQYLEDIAKFAESALSAYGCVDRETMSDLLLAIDEVCTNIMTHGKPSQQRDYLTLEIERVENALSIIITDFGAPFPFETLKPVSPDAPLEEKLAHGFGIGFIKRLTDEQHYRSFGERNELYLRRNLS